VAPNAKSHSSPTRADQSTAENVGQKEEAAEDDKRKFTQSNPILQHQQ
jgi:hypothetical protein